MLIDLVTGAQQVFRDVERVPIDAGGIAVSGPDLHSAGFPAQRMVVETVRNPLHIYHRPPLLLDSFPR